MGLITYKSFKIIILWFSKWSLSRQNSLSLFKFRTRHANEQQQNLYGSKSKSKVYRECRHENQVTKHGSWLRLRTQTELSVKVRHNSPSNKWSPAMEDTKFTVMFWSNSFKWIRWDYCMLFPVDHFFKQ